jgi:hypothetical protein
MELLVSRSTALGELPGTRLYPCFSFANITPCSFAFQSGYSGRLKVTNEMHQDIYYTGRSFFRQNIMLVIDAMALRAQQEEPHSFIKQSRDY